MMIYLTPMRNEPTHLFAPFADRCPRCDRRALAVWNPEMGEWTVFRTCGHDLLVEYDGSVQEGRCLRLTAAPWTV